MDIIINNAILHIIHNDGRESYISNEELDIDSDICYEFITKHVKKLLNNPAAREATFSEGSKALAIVEQFKAGELYFKEASAQLCTHLQTIIEGHPDIPSADVMVVQFETRTRGRSRKEETLLDSEYLAVLKLNHKACFTHKVGEGANGTDNQLVKYDGVLPFENGKVEEACLIPYDPMIIRLLEKPYNMGGEAVHYFSERFLECQPSMSKKELVTLLSDVSEEINSIYYNDNVEQAAKIKVALMDESIEEEGLVSAVGVASRAFADNEEARTAFIEQLKEAGMPPDAPLGEKLVRQQFGAQKFKASNGIEIKFPAELSDDSEAIAFTHNPDGTVTVTLKNLRKA